MAFVEEVSMVWILETENGESGQYLQRCKEEASGGVRAMPMHWSCVSEQDKN